MSRPSFAQTGRWRDSCSFLTRFSSCHNIYLVLPQLIVTGLSSIIFAIFAPEHSVLVPPVVLPPSTATAGVLKEAIELVARQQIEATKSWDALGLIFRIGGVSAAVSTWLCWRMMREWERDRIRRRST